MPFDNLRHSVAVIGGGISGLTTAFLLKEKGVDVTLLEKRDYPGGVIRSVQTDGWLLERGPNTVMAKSERLWNLVQKLDLSEEIIQPGSEASKRYIVKEGIPHALPTSLFEFIKSKLFSTSAKFRLFKEPFIPKSESPESIANFFERRLGKEVLDYAVNPFVAGIYAGDPKKLSIAHTLSKVYELEQEFGSIVKGAVKSKGGSKSNKKLPRKGLISFNKGIQQLPARLGEHLGSSLHLESEVTAIQGDSQGWKVAIKGEQPQSFDAIMYTVPLHQLKSIDIDAVRHDLLDHLATLRYAPIATTCFGFKREHIRHPLDGFGMLVPEVEPFNILGCLFSSSLFKGRARGEHALLTCFVGGDRNPEHVELPDNEIRAMVLEDLEALLGCSGDPVFESIHRWKKAIPQYGLDYQTYLDAMDDFETQNPGFFFTGNFRKEVSVPGCIEQAYETADRAASFLQS
ncbi:protoporphyrinogen oxidase [Aliifodinibius sp. S!AR15-10]|uniref:protoporphyrinogen oxidase n=1 Tax=Aliifodinibius sp. S!AR15-10 TaxID=2950437 RepID=UPI00285EA826|nr:protoporphyrinogen oxidase [Aliifodinibius sp. S!AR15-10]MDR8392492.1 protoporphyrinogen oxidase [Aliifodinibius sp. S!AR15-10]